MFDIDPRIVEFLLESDEESVEGSLMPTHVVIVAEYIDSDGDSRWSAHTQGNGRISGAVGLLEFAKDQLIEDMKEWS